MTANSAHQSVGEGGIGIQNVGDGNTVIVYAGRAELSLLRKHARKAEPKTELQLLRSIFAPPHWSGGTRNWRRCRRG